MEPRLIQTSKFLSYVLRHEPEAIGLSLDPGGWADIDELLECARAEGRPVSRSRINAVIQSGEKSRFTLSDDEAKIRATYGHSLDVDLNLEPTPPPNDLYHGTAESTVPTIRREGLLPQSRQYVHLSSTQTEAESVGHRHGKAVVLVVRAADLHEDGHALYKSTDAVWLTRHVPPHYLAFPDE